jgi:CRP-like cAMP-binding protein
VLIAFEHGNLMYELRYFLTELLEDDSTESAVRVHLFASLQRAGIRIAEEQRTSHAVTKDEAHAETVRQRELSRRLQMLRQVDLLGPLSDEERNFVAERLQYAPFARGDVITKQGNKAHWLYILAYGEAEVLYEPQGGAAQVIGTVHAGQFFGEMALLTGDARAATVVAKTDVECYRLDRASFQEMLAGKPQIADEIKKVMGGRRGDLDSARQAFTVAAPVAEAEVRLVSKIRRFLGMR